MLIVDKYSSYVNIFFIDYAKRYYIIVLMLPFYTTNRLKLLDISLFSLFSKAYSKKLSDFIIKHKGLINMTKKIFYLFYKKDWKELFIKTNIEFI